MIISTKKGTPKEELEKIVDKFEHQGLDVTLITGKDYNVFGLVGDTTKIDEGRAGQPLDRQRHPRVCPVQARQPPVPPRRFGH